MQAGSNGARTFAPTDRVTYFSTSVTGVIGKLFSYRLLLLQEFMVLTTDRSTLIFFPPNATDREPEQLSCMNSFKANK